LGGTKGRQTGEDSKEGKKLPVKNEEKFMN
jgi:hypothetical protein